MIRGRLARLEKALDGAATSDPCAWCGATRGVGRAPLIILDDDPTNLAPYDPTGHCPRCGALAPVPTSVPTYGLMAVLSSIADPIHRKLMVALSLSVEAGTR